MRLLSTRFLLAASLLLPAAALGQPVDGCPGDDSPLAALDSIPAPSFRAEGARVAVVPADVQRDTLAAILSRVREMRDARAADPSQPRGVVVLDIDYTAMMHTRRTEESLRRVGERYGISELEDPTLLSSLPTYEKSGFERWIDAHGLRERYPDMNWNKFRNEVNAAGWTNDLKSSEDITPGLVEFLRRVKYTGGRVVFLTGRAAAQREDVLAVFREAGIEDPILYMKSGSGSTPKWKADRIPEIEAAHGAVVAVVDDMRDNREAILEKLAGRDVLDVPVAVPGFTIDMSAEELDASPHRISTFERDRADG